MNSLTSLRYLLLPLHVAPLILVVLFSVGLTLALQAGLWGVPVLAILVSWFFKYGFALLDDVMDGRSEPPVLSAEMVNPIEQRPFGLFLLLLGFFVLTGGAEAWIGSKGVTLIRIVLLCLVPAIVATTSATGSLLAALNPKTVLGVVARIPTAYALLLATLGALWTCGLLLLQLFSAVPAGIWHIESFLPLQLINVMGGQGLLHEILAFMLFMYLWLAMFAFIGGTLFENRLQLGLEAAASPERLAARRQAELDRERDKLMDPVFAELRGGALSNAGASVRKLIADSSEPLETCRWIYARAAAAADQRLADYVAQVMLPRLLDVKATGEILDVLQQRLSANAGFRPATSGELLKLSRLARDAGRRPIARTLLADFDRYFPNDALTAQANKLQAELAP